MAKRGPRKKEIHPNSNQPWTQEDSDFIMNSDMKDKDIAEKIGRSERAVQNQRHLLYQEQKEMEDK